MSLLQYSASQARVKLLCSISLGHGDESAGKAAHVTGGHDSAFFHSIVQKGKGRSGAVDAAFFKAHYLKYLGHTVTNGGGGGQGQALPETFWIVSMIRM